MVADVVVTLETTMLEMTGALVTLKVLVVATLLEAEIFPAASNAVT